MIRFAPFIAIGLTLLACASPDQTGPQDPTMQFAPSGTLAVSAGQVLLEDDFSAPPLDLLKWRTFTNIPQGGAAVLVDGSHAVMINRGHLTTVAQFPPRALGGIRISGDWRFASGAPDDFLQILTRSNGFPLPGNPFGETAHGIEFIAFTSAVVEDPNAMYIQGRGRAAGSVTGLSNSGSLVLTPGKTYHFEVADFGQAVSFTLTDPANPANFRTVVASSPYPGDFHHVVFHNREQCCLGNHRAFLDNVRIEGGMQ
jgi:hypothetical protein